MEEKVTADTIRKALQEKYQEDEWYLGFEVGDSCGSLLSRHADAVAINAYPSRGFEVRGFEIKVSRSDLKHELEISAKADAVAKYCNYWFLVVPKGLTKDMQIPEPWGIIEYKDGKLKQVKTATYMKNICDFGFLCAFIRGRKRIESVEYSYNRQQMFDEVKKQYETYYAPSSVRELKRLQKSLSEIEEKTGINITTYNFDTNRICEYIKLAQKIMDKKWEFDSIERNIEDIKEAGKILTNVYKEIKDLAEQCEVNDEEDKE